MKPSVHGSSSADAFFVWAESSEATPRKPGRKPRIPPHPHAASPARLRAVLQDLAPSVEWEAVPSEERIILLPSAADAPCLPPWLVPDARDPDAELHLSPWKVTGLALDLLSALHFLVALPLGEDQQEAVRSRQWGADLHYWSLVAKFGLELLAHHRYLPGMAEHEGQYRARWLPVLEDIQDQTRLRRLAEAMPPVCRAVFAGRKAPEPEQAPEPRDLLDRFLKQLVDQAVRDWGRPRLDGRRKPPEGVAGAWWSALWDDVQAQGSPIEVPLSQRRDLARLFDAWQAWIGQLRGLKDVTFRLCVRLEPPEVDPESGQVLSPDWLLRYMLQANDDPSLLVPAEKVWEARGGTLRILNRKFEGAQERLLAGLGLAGRLFPPIMKSLRTARPDACPLTVDEAYAFLREVGPLLEGSGFGVLVPPWWDKPGARLGVRARLQTPDTVAGQGFLGMDTLVQFDWELALGDEALTYEEFQRLAALKMPLVQVRGQWVLLQPDQIEAAIAFWEKKRKQAKMSLHDALSLALGADEEVAGLPLQGVETSGWLDSLLDQLGAGDQMQELVPPQAFEGQLRPYQVRGYSWLHFLRKWGLGACLADDMGLGKTIQAIRKLPAANRVAMTGTPVENRLSELWSIMQFLNPGLLGSLTRLKQVCNHPAQFLGDGSALPGRSGKFDRMGEMLEEALSIGDRALVFTQFAEMGHMLQAYLQSLFGIEVLFLYGGTPQKQRDRMVARFQGERAGPPVFILSLKAGGTGLNLTAANHVFHFDRWWNPAVEDQATDRAFRIGQAQDVQVHKFLCAGTLEERIDEMIESKKALAESVVGASEGWLTELSTDELRDMMSLRRD